MNKGCKITIIIVAVIFIGALIGGYFFLNMLGDAFGAECEKTKKWTVQEYQIQEYRCFGWAGPPWYPMDIYENGNEITNDIIRKDSCLIGFRKEKELYLYLNICENSIKEIRPNKNLLSTKSIDSIQIVSKTTNQTKKLNEQQIRKIVTDWNKSQVWDYRDEVYDSIFYPEYDYELYVYQKKKKTEFITENYLMADRNQWTYIMSSEKNKKYFNEIWNGK
jgi:hypothetical protein